MKLTGLAPNPDPAGAVTAAFIGKLSMLTVIAPTVADVGSYHEVRNP